MSSDIQQTRELINIKDGTPAADISWSPLWEESQWKHKTAAAAASTTISHWHPNNRVWSQSLTERDNKQIRTDFNFIETKMLSSV